ncbi:MAG: diguanylate cyclase, partial [Planctomycetales bacterium]|nr:diguanylate cyclase [Planctomycetales bacterium]
MPTVDVQPELRLPLDGTRVLVVGAFSSLLGQLVAYLERSFAAVTVVPDHTAIHATEADFADLILVTAAPCPTATLNWIGQLRRQPSSDATTIILVDTNAEADHLGTTLSAIDAGADDYVFLDQQIELAMARIAGVYERRRIHEQHHLHELRLEQSVRGANDGLWYCDLRSGRFYLSARGHQLLGDAEHDAEHSRADWMRRIHPEDREHVERNLQRHLLGGTPHFESELRLQHANGTYRWMFCRGLAITSGDNEPSAIAGSLTDITTGKVADPLTSLPNRLLLLDRLQQSIDRWHEDQTSSFAILYIDIDNFKMVNDTLGHDVGDQLLMSVAKRLQQSIRADDSIVARLGGDEFAILMDDVRDLEESEMAAQRILSVMSQPYFFDGREVFACASIGISAPSSHTQTADELLREADTAMYEAKAEGKSRCRVFHPSMRDALT